MHLKVWLAADKALKIFFPMIVMNLMLKMGKISPLISKITGIPLKKGQRVRLETPGGGGYGDVKKRSKARIDYDLKQGYVTQVKQ